MSIGGEASFGRLHLDVDEGGYSAHAGCNSMGGDFTFTATGEGVGTFEVGTGTRTLMSCGKEAHEREDEFSAAFHGADRWESHGRVLRLSGAAEMVFEIFDDIDTLLQGPTWRVDSFALGGVRASTFGGTVVSLAMAGGRYYAHTGCRRLECRYELELDGPNHEGMILFHAP